MNSHEQSAKIQDILSDPPPNLQPRDTAQLSTATHHANSQRLPASLRELLPANSRCLLSQPPPDTRDASAPRKRHKKKCPKRETESPKPLWPFETDIDKWTRVKEMNDFCESPVNDFCESPELERGKFFSSLDDDFDRRADTDRYGERVARRR